MWVLIQKTIDNKKKKYIVSDNYDYLIEYIKRFKNLKKYSDIIYISFGHEVIEFKIVQAELMER